MYSLRKGEKLAADANSKIKPGLMLSDQRHLATSLIHNYYYSVELIQRKKERKKT